MRPGAQGCSADSPAFIWPREACKIKLSALGLQEDDLGSSVSGVKDCKPAYYLTCRVVLSAGPSLVDWRLRAPFRHSKQGCPLKTLGKEQRPQLLSCPLLFWNMEGILASCCKCGPLGAPAEEETMLVPGNTSWVGRAGKLWQVTWGVGGLKA